jgi:hypothetical protein
MSRLALATALAALALTATAVGARAEPPAPRPVPIEPTAADRNAWQQRVREARDAVVRADARQREAELAYDRMRHRDHPRGKGAAAVLAERIAAREDAGAAHARLDEVLEQARRAGAPPGWLRAEASQAGSAESDSQPAHPPASSER